jgi:hypothetical protein
VERRLACVLTVAVALVATGCGAEMASDGNGSVGSEEAGSARFETITRTTLGSEEHLFSASGVLDYARDRRETISAYPEQRSGQKSFRAIQIGTVSWWELPESESSKLGGKRWLRSDGAEAEAAFAKSVEHEEAANAGLGVAEMSVSFAVGLPVADTAPDEILAYLQGVAPKPERLGVEDVRGVETTHHQTALDQRRALRRDLEREGWADANIERALEGMSSRPVEIELWIGADGLVRRVRWRDESSEEPRWSSETTTEFFDFGVETNIQPPPATDVAEQDEWLRVIEAENDVWLEEGPTRLLEPDTLDEPDGG